MRVHRYTDGEFECSFRKLVVVLLFASASTRWLIDDFCLKMDGEKVKNQSRIST
jgi:hypothetical protein